MRKSQDKKKKVSSTANLFMKVNEKNDKINLKFALNMFVPKSTNILISPKGHESGKMLKMTVTTPKPKCLKKSVKENAYHSTFVSNNNSYVSTPFEYEIVDNKQKSRNDYKFLYQVGSGGFGRVWKVQEKRTNETLAMKQISKAKVILKKSVNSVINEKSILEHISNPYIINMKSAFQDRQYLYLIMEYLRGGDLRYHLCFYQFFTEEQTKFITGNIVLALEYIHHKGIIHRDLKPQNLVFQENGYLRITDFGVARRKRQTNSEETSGTPGYMAPEVICRMNHSFEADYFALGVIVYEMMLGSRPYMGETRKQIRDKILAHQARISEKQLPIGWNPAAMDFVNKLIKRNKQSRLGYNGIEEIKKHEWLSSLNWKKLAKKQLTPPFIPGVVTQSHQYQREMQSTIPSMADQQSEMLLRTTEIQNLFKEYSESKKMKKQRL